jgi:hypothetical protein
MLIGVMILNKWGLSWMVLVVIGSLASSAGMDGKGVAVSVQSAAFRVKT